MRRKNRAHAFQGDWLSRPVPKDDGDAESGGRSVCAVQTELARLLSVPNHRRHNCRVDWSRSCAGTGRTRCDDRRPSSGCDQDSRCRDENPSLPRPPLRLRNERIKLKRESEGVHRHRAIIGSTRRKGQESKTQGSFRTPAWGRCLSSTHRFGPPSRRREQPE
jgi:hypothetical protein